MAIARATLRRDLAYAAAYVPFAVMHAPAFMVLPALYVQHAGLSLVGVGLTLTVLRVLDAAIDPVVGLLSDNTRSRLGRRKPWILLGAVVGGLATLAAFQPGPQTGYAYFAIAYFFMTLGWTFAEIPHPAWINEITRDERERHRLATWRYNAEMMGTALFPAIALLPFFATSEMTPEVTRMAAWMVVALLLLTLPPLLRWVPDSPVSARPRATRGRIVRDAWRALAGNRALRSYALLSATTWLSQGMVSGLYFFYLNQYLHIGDRYSYVMLAVYALQLLGASWWLRMGTRLEKHRIVAICTLLTAATNVSMYLIAPGPHAFAALLVVFSVAAIGVAGATSAQVAMLADVVDFGRLRSHGEHAGNYFAVRSFLNKFCLAVGAGAGFVIAGWFGFDPKRESNDTAALQGFFVAIVWIPCALNLLSAWMAWRFPLGRHQVGLIQARLSRRSNGAGADRPGADAAALRQCEPGGACP
ncbi:MFS transporter [Stenotrophomonas sp. MMGLT7]|uniref:MFS transporter n=1 Tax=Stenotrophomonas sp. MMGLT7 TaxID=2901227 RepID=UPI001E3E3C58|nr:MFS transporter [Stenotrophomonas sp. MMGLT7]MCD7097917.1 MFS transporter [Stenotrophomonas sp. MMGLT7]